MNRIHRIVFNHALGLFQVASEHARGRGRRKTMRIVGVAALLQAAASTLIFAAAPASAQDVSIDHGATETVDGTMAGTRPSPWEIDGDLIVGELGAGVLTIENGGQVFNEIGFIGDESNSHGEVKVSGSSADGTASTWTNSGFLAVGFNGTGRLAIENGGVVISQDTVVGEMASGSGEIALNSNGVLATGSVGRGLGAGTLLFDGGILRATADTSNFLRNFNAGDVIIEDNGAFIDSNGHDVGIGADLQGSGGLTKIGEGTLTLSGQNSYAGATTVEAGTLRADTYGALVDNNAYVINGGTLDLSDYRAPAGVGVATLEMSSLAGSGGTLAMGDTYVYVDQSGETAFDGDITGADARLKKWGEGTLTLGGQISGLGAGLYAEGGVLALNGANTYTGWTVIGDSVLEVGHDQALSVGRVLIRSDHSVLRATRNMTLANEIEFNIALGTLTLDASHDLTLTGNISDPTPGIGGNIVKTGGGTLTLAGQSGHRGETTVQGGTLIVDGSIERSSQVTVQQDATLGGSGRVGKTTIEDGGRLAPGGNAIGTLTFSGGLTMLPGSILDYQLGSPGTEGDPASGRSDRIEVDGDLALNGVTLNLMQSSDPADGVTSLGFYRLMTYSGSLTGDYPSLGQIPHEGKDLYALYLDSGRVDLFVPAAASLGDDALQHWQGGDGTWSAGGTTWLNAGDGAPDGDIPVAWAGNHAVFKNQPGDFDGGVVAVEGAHSFKGLQFVDEGYRLQGDGSLETDAGGSEIRVLADRAEIATEITGTGGITKTEGGTLVLSGDNSYAGGTTLGAGVLSISSDTNLGQADGALMFAGGSLAATASLASDRAVTLDRDGRFDVADNATLQVNGSIAGAGDLYKNGAGVLVTAGGMSIGAMRVQNGELQVAGGANLLNGTILVDAGAGDQANLAVDGESTSVEAIALTVGQSGKGLFDLTSGARVTMPGLSSANAFVIGYSGNADGQATISGADSRLRINGGTTRIGRNATGSLTVQDGGRFESGYLVVIGGDANGDGLVTVSGPTSTFVTTGNAPTYVGDTGSGTLNILDGGRVETSFFASVGRGYDGQGTALVKGVGSSWIVDGNLYIGENGQGTVVLADGGYIDLVDFATSRATLGRNEDGSGTLVIGAEADAAPTAAGTISARAVDFSTGAGKLVFNHTDEHYVFGLALQKDTFSTDPSGDHSIDHLAGHTVYRGNGRTFDGITTISGGTLTVDGRLGGSIDVKAGGALGGSGTVGDTTIADGGILAPGSSVGTLTVAGGLALSSGSVLEYELGAPGLSVPSPGASDRIEVLGDLTLDGTLNLAQSSDTEDGAAGLGYYRLMTYVGELTDNLLTIGHGLNLDAGYDIQAGDNRVDLFIGAAGNDMLQHWQGGDGLWSAANPQWLNKDGELPVAWAGNHAAFKNQPGGFNGGTIDVEGMQRFAGLQFIDEGYRLQGAGSLETVAGSSEIRVLADSAEIATEITGTGGITKTEAGTLVLSGNNTYAGGTTLAGGVVSVSSDANLGREDGALTFDGGVLQVAGADFNDTERQIIWGARGGGFDIVNEANNFYVDQNIIGPGDLVKRGDGALTLAGENRYGNTRVEGGWLLGHAGSISGDIANAGVVAFLQDEDARFAGDITGLEGSDGTMVKDGAGSLTLEGRSLLDWSIVSGALITEASRFEGDAHLDGATGGLTFTDAKNGVYGGTISGVGQFKLDGAGTVRLTGDSSHFAGTTTLSNGTLLVGDADGNGSLGGSLDVQAGATLGGSGTVGAGAGSRVAVASDGTLAPGNSVGTLTVDGDLVFEAGSRFEVEVDPQGGESDQVAVTGSATLNGGSVAHIGAGGDYDLRSSHTILSAGGALSGRFDEVSSDFAFLKPELLYDYGAGTVDLELSRNDREFASAALTQNQGATANAIESIGFNAGHAVYDAIAQLPDDEALIRSSFDALSGEIHASARTALIEDSRFVRNAANDRVRAAFATPGASTAPVQAYGSALTPTQVSASDSGPVVWSQAFGSWGSTDSDGNAARLDRDAKGLLIGADRRVGAWRVGLLAGYSRSDFKARDRASSAKSDNYHLGLYGGTQRDALGLRAGLAYTWHDVDTKRSISLPGLSDSAGAGYHAGTLQAFGEVGYSIDAGPVRVEPYAGLAHVRLHTDSYSERGGAAALSGRSENTDVTFSTLGLRAEHRLSAGAIEATLRAAVGWRHAFGDTIPTARHGLSEGDIFVVAGVPIAKDSAVVEAGVDLSLAPGATLGFSYSGQLAGSARDHGAKANLMIRF
ncbi:autotransporter outer membrane beta-barrel domain-containing protein [Pusillimonas caeni]|uniref:autotransporter domain-containing protein n=1 Tax=Pusillimonas caeni TaxID=1348472 RepID=UPI000E59F5C3|nr:autotransporter domain-containing protein [Pusillimonas caeni]TFL13039.1 autotransporter outer membrane beta-barrel domain-containing protein [Pusillimonas caeni]